VSIGAPDGRIWRGRAPAKVNLALRVLAREASGYHQLETVFQALDLADEIEIEVPGAEPHPVDWVPEHSRAGAEGEVDASPGGGSNESPDGRGGEGPEVELDLVGVPRSDLGPDRDNLAVRAAEAFMSAWVRRSGLARSRSTSVRIRLKKRIPHGAGLGGGSSDAATVLIGMNALFDHPIPDTELVQIGGRLGADVPFFLSRVPRALAWGRGDRVAPLRTLPVRPVLLAVPSVGIATPWAYGELARHRSTLAEPGPGAQVSGVIGWRGWSEVAAAAHNDFEAALFPLRKELGQLRGILADEGAAPALLSGSGAAVFGVFDPERDLGRVEASVRAAVPGVRVIRTHTAG